MARVLITASSVAPQQDAPCLDILRDAGHEPVFADIHGARLSEPELAGQLPGVAGVMASGEPYTRAIFKGFPELRVIARLGVGFDAIDLDAAAEHKVPVMIAIDANDTTVAETTVALMLALARDLGEAFAGTARGEWARRPSTELRDKTIGIIGLGRIGRGVVRRVRGFDVTIVAAEKYPDARFIEQQSIELVEIDEVFRRADFLTLHTPLTAETRHLVNARRLEMMKPSAFLINTARGGLVDETALYTALTTGGVAGAALDVFASEPPTDLRLAQLPNVLPTPHLAGVSRESIVRMSNVAAQNVVDVLNGSWGESMVVNGVFSA